jgi:hypothetical protein
MPTERIAIKRRREKRAQAKAERKAAKDQVHQDQDRFNPVEQVRVTHG